MTLRRTLRGFMMQLTAEEDDRFTNTKIWNVFPPIPTNCYNADVDIVNHVVLPSTIIKCNDKPAYHTNRRWLAKSRLPSKASRKNHLAKIQCEYGSSNGDIFPNKAELSSSE